MSQRISPISVFPATAQLTFPDVIRSASNDFWLEGMGTAASLASDAEHHVVFLVPPSLPTGTGKLEIFGYSYNNANGNAKVNPAWKSLALGESFDNAFAGLNAEGVQTVAWNSGTPDGFKFMQAKVTLDADTIVAGEYIQVIVLFDATDWTLDQRAVWLYSIIWE